MVPAVHEQAPSRHPRTWLFALPLLALAAGPAAAEPRGVARVVYEFAVTSYCGLLDPAVERGYRAEVAAATARAGLDPETARRQRIQGWIEAEREWRNRGLGGNRAWCADEGAAAADHFQAIAEGRRQP
jgi:hypothetical protein